MISVAIPLICGLTIVTMFLGILFVVKSWFIFNGGGGGGGGSFHENIPICIASCTYCPIHILYVVCWRNAQKMGIFNYYFHCWIVTQVYWIIDSTDSFKNADWFSNSWMCMSVSGFCHFGLVSFMGFVTESWHSRHVLFLCECAASAVLEPCALSSACLFFVLERGVRIPALISWVSVSCRGFGHSRCLCSVSLCECAILSSLGALLSTCVLWCCTQFVFLSATCIHVMSFTVWHAACVFIGCVLSCCHVLCSHAAYEYSH